MSIVLILFLATQDQEMIYQNHNAKFRSGACETCYQLSSEAWMLS